jgi:hypothetical protein
MANTRQSVFLRSYATFRILHLAPPQAGSGAACPGKGTKQNLDSPQKVIQPIFQPTTTEAAAGIYLRVSTVDQHTSNQEHELRQGQNVPAGKW